MSHLEDGFRTQLRMRNAPAWTEQFKPWTERRYRIDFAWPEEKLAVEIEGGTWIRGAHSRGKHFESDCYKYNRLALEGWRVLRFTTDMVEDWRAVDTVLQALKASGEA